MKKCISIDEELLCEGLVMQGSELRDVEPGVETWTERVQKLANAARYGEDYYLTDEDRDAALAEVLERERHKAALEAFREAELGRLDAEAISRNRSERIIFVRAEDYSVYARTRRKMRFLNSDGEHVRVVHAFPIREGQLEELNASHDCTFREVQVPLGYRVYALRWGDVQDFVGSRGGGGLLGGAGWGWASPDVEPPELLVYTEEHAPRYEVRAHYCWCGCGDYEGSSVEAEITHQVVFSPVPLVAVIGEDIPEEE